MQVVLDRTRGAREAPSSSPDGGAWSVSILIFDALQIGGEDFVQMQLPPKERYRRLRELCTTDPHVLTSPAMKVQWAGEFGALKNFCSGPDCERNIDHIPDCYLMYTRKHPCKVVVVE